MKRFQTPVMVVAVAFVSCLTLAQEKTTQQVTVTGFVTDSGCGPAGAQAGHNPAKCVKLKGAKWAIYDEANKTLYVLANPEIGPKMMDNKVAGEKLKVSGMVDPKTKEMKVVEWISRRLLRAVSVEIE
jgi:hypothetical protein